MGVARENETGGGAMLPGEADGKRMSGAPGRENTEDAQGRPHGIGREAQGVFDGIALGLMALGDLDGGAAPDGQPVLQGGGGGQRGGVDEPPNLRGIVAPRHEVVEEHIAVRDEDLAGSELEGVERGKIGIVITGEQRDRGWDRREQVSDIAPQLGGEGRIGAGPRVERIAIEDERRNSGEERVQLRQIADLTGAVAVVQIGKDAGEWTGHGKKGGRLSG